MAEESGLFASLKRVVAGLVGIVACRVELLANEWEEERLRLIQALFFGLFALFSLCMGILFVAILFVLFYWHDHPLLAVALLSLVFFAFSAFFLHLSRGKLQQKTMPFSNTLSELQKDIDSLRGNHE